MLLPLFPGVPAVCRRAGHYILLAAMLAGIGLDSGCQQQKPTEPATTNSTRTSTPRVVIYPLKTTPLRAAMRWYSILLNTPFEEGTDAPKFPYATATVDGVTIYLTTDPDYLRVQQQQPIYYWMLDGLPEMNALEKKLDSERIPATVSPRPQPGESLPGFIVTLTVEDPDGNKVGVMNNPIFVPKLELNSSSTTKQPTK